MTTQSQFDLLFDGDDDDLFCGLASRIQSCWSRYDDISDLPPQAALIARLACLKATFDNGGLLFFFECDHPALGRAVAVALRTVGLDAGARALTEAYDMYPTQGDYDDCTRRFAIFEQRRAEFDRIDNQLGFAVDKIVTATSLFARRYRSQYEYLRARLEANPSTDQPDGRYDAG